MRIHKKRVIEWGQQLETIDGIYEEYKLSLNHNAELDTLNQQLIAAYDNLNLQLEQKEVLINKRFLYFVPTEILHKANILRNTRWKRRKPKDINPNNFNKIDLGNPIVISSKETVFEFPLELGKVRNVISSHAPSSYYLSQRNNNLKIKNNSEFWAISNVIIIEIEGND